MSKQQLPELELQASCLTSKWGFHDGDIVQDYFYDLEDSGCQIPEVHHQGLLIHLVRKYLLPELDKRGITYEVHEIGTNHSPIRAYTINGEEVELYNSDYSHPALEGISISLPAELVLEEARELSY